MSTRMSHHHLFVVGPLYFHLATIDTAMLFGTKLFLFLGRAEDRCWACITVKQENAHLNSEAVEAASSLHSLTVLHPLQSVYADRQQTAHSGSVGLFLCAKCTANPEREVEFCICPEGTPPPCHEHWIQNRLPSFLQCNIHAVRIGAGKLAFELASLVRLLNSRSTALGNKVAFEQDIVDPCILRFVCSPSQLDLATGPAHGHPRVKEGEGSTKLVHTLRVCTASAFHAAAGCVAAPHQIKFNAESHSAHYRFAATLTFEQVCNVAGWVACSVIPDSAYVLLTVCSKHGVLRLCAEDPVYHDCLDVLVDALDCTTVTLPNTASHKHAKHPRVKEGVA